MFSFLSRHLPTIIGAMVVFGLVALSVAKQIRDYRSHKSGCGCGCDHCPGARACHPR
jgi:hypothetical protein